MSDKLLKLAHAAQVCRDHLDKWEREKVKFSETIQGLLVRVLFEEGESRHYIVGMVDGLRRANQPYKFGNLTPSEHALLLDTHGHSSSFLMNTVSNTLIGQGELDQWIQTKGYTPEEVAEKLQQRISAFQYLKKYGQQDPARADRATHAINPENILMEGGETFDEDLCCTCCYELPLRPLRCKEDHILCESCFRESKRGSQPNLAFNPAENGKLRLYASTSILYWGTKKLLPFIRGWNNGEVIAMQKKNGCIAKVRTIVSGLPVSNYDHSVNGLSFDNWGNLMISVGGTTNAGVSVEGGPLGGIPDSPLSGAVLQAPVLKRGFNGKIVYSQYGNPHTARKVSGDVRVYAAGLRNSFSNVVHSNGNIYALDNGANSKFGARSTGCNTETNATGEPDTLKKLRPNGFFGYANRNRGRFDTRQCIHRPPQKNIGNYDRHIATFKSSMNGLVEYTANTFGAQMRGDLLATKFAVSGSGIVFRVQLNKKGNVKSKFEIAKHSGLSVAMSGTGGLFMPRVYQSKVATLMPIERNPGRLVVTSVNPFRGPRRGGGKVTITGWNLFPPLVITFGGKECRKLENFNKGRSLTCIVPAGQGKAAVIASRLSSSSRSFGFEYVYMNV